MSASSATWVLFAVSVFGLWLTGQHPRAGWRFALVNQILLWLPWAIWARQPGLIAQALVFAAIYARNLHRWRYGTMALSAPDCSRVATLHPASPAKPTELVS